MRSNVATIHRSCSLTSIVYAGLADGWLDLCMLLTHFCVRLLLCEARYTASQWDVSHLMQH